MTETIQEKNYQFYLKADVSRYIGEWVAVAEDRIIAHGKSLKEVAQQARENSHGKKFLLARVPSEATMIF